MSAWTRWLNWTLLTHSLPLATAIETHLCNAFFECLLLFSEKSIQIMLDHNLNCKLLFCCNWLSKNREKSKTRSGLESRMEIGTHLGTCESKLKVSGKFFQSASICVWKEGKWGKTRPVSWVKQQAVNLWDLSAIVWLSECSLFYFPHFFLAAGEQHVCLSPFLLSILSIYLSARYAMQTAIPVQGISSS